MIISKLLSALGNVMSYVGVQGLDLIHTVFGATLRSNTAYRDAKDAVSYRVVPVHTWDLPLRSAVVYHLSRFNAPLDANKLKDSLVKLIDRDGGWRKLGARLRQNVSLTLEPLDGANLI